MSRIGAPLQGIQRLRLASEGAGILVPRTHSVTEHSCASDFFGRRSGVSHRPGAQPESSTQKLPGPAFQVPDWSGDKGVREGGRGRVHQEEARWRWLGAAGVFAPYVKVCCGGAGMARREAAGAGVSTGQARFWGEKPFLVVRLPRVGLTGRTRRYLSLGSRAGATSHRVDCEMSPGVA